MFLSLQHLNKCLCADVSLAQLVLGDLELFGLIHPWLQEAIVAGLAHFEATSGAREFLLADSVLLEFPYFHFCFNQLLVGLLQIVLVALGAVAVLNVVELIS